MVTSLDFWRNIYRDGFAWYWSPLVLRQCCSSPSHSCRSWRSWIVKHHHRCLYLHNKLTCRRNSWEQRCLTSCTCSSWRWRGARWSGKPNRSWGGWGWWDDEGEPQKGAGPAEAQYWHHRSVVTSFRIFLLLLLGFFLLKLYFCPIVILFLLFYNCIYILLPSYLFQTIFPPHCSTSADWESAVAAVRQPTYRFFVFSFFGVTPELSTCMQSPWLKIRGRSRMTSVR